LIKCKSAWHFQVQARHAREKGRAMARLPRVYIEGILYYITSTGGHSQNIFADPVDYKEYISLIARYKEQYGFKLFSYVLLPTHLHMLIELKNNIGISNIMHDINSLYTKIFNSRYNKKGHLFLERFKATLAEKESYLLQLTRHIHLNPKRAKLVYDPKDYPYSSLCQYLDPAKRQHPDMKMEIEEVFNVLKGREQALEEYVKNAEQRQLNELKKNLRKKRILGSKDFVERIKKTIEESAKQQKKTPAQKRAQVLYMMLGGAAVVVLAISVGYFHKQHTALKSEYDKTMLLYERTLEMLKRERDKALKANMDIEKYMWKIKLTEKALEELKRKKKEAVKVERELEGWTLGIKLTQIGGPRESFDNTDTIFFKDNRVASVNLRQEGFPDSNYSKRELKSGNLVWETIQTNKRGETASWRGEWDGRNMKGILRRRSADGTIRDFSFVGTGERVRR